MSDGIKPEQSEENNNNNAGAGGEESKDLKNEQITLRVADQNGNDIHFKIKRSTKFQKLMENYCTRKGISSNGVRFLFDGKRLNADQTPNDYDMENGDSVDALLEQQGGSF